MPIHVGFLCERSDNMGGGASILANMRSAWGKLNKEAQKVLESESISEGKFFDLEHVGKELKKFKIIQYLHGHFLFRLTTKMVYDDYANCSEEFLMALSQFEEILKAQQFTVLLKSNEILVINQSEIAHGRLPLVENSGADSSPAPDRQLWQIFFN